MAAFGFCPKILGGDGDLQMVCCCSVNAGWVDLHRWNTQILPAVIKFL